MIKIKNQDEFQNKTNFKENNGLNVQCKRIKKKIY